jgi:hypothetical protein
MKLVPAAWFTLPVLFFIRVVASLFSTASRMALSVMSTHAIAADRKARGPLRWRIGLLLLALLVGGYIVCGMSHLSMNYRHCASLDQTYQSPINHWGTQRFVIAANDMKDFALNGDVRRAFHNRSRSLLFGAGTVLLLEIATLSLPAWPLHPIGLLMVDSYYANAAWPSVFLGWLCSALVLRYGGSRAYRLAGRVFVGIIVGDILAGVYWSVESAIMAWLKIPYSVIWVQPS